MVGNHSASVPNMSLNITEPLGIRDIYQQRISGRRLQPLQR